MSASVGGTSAGPAPSSVRVDFSSGVVRASTPAAAQIADHLEEMFEATGSRGGFMLSISQAALRPMITNVVDYLVPELKRRGRYRSAYAVEMAHFFDVLATGKPARTSVKDGLAALVLAEAAPKSLREGNPVHLGDAHDGKLADVLAAVGAAAQ